MPAIFLFLLLFMSAFPTRIYAFNDPLAVPNNRYGIHIADTNDLGDIPTLVNSTGGDWGYVTLVIGEGERDTNRWQKVFDYMRRQHLIPIVRLATHLEKDIWVEPSADTIDIWVSFLSSLNWPIENRYVIVYNEPNHAKEWGGVVNPEQYASFFVELAGKLKTFSEDFFILPAGLDASATTNSDSLDEAQFLQRMIKAQPDLLEHVDGWASHSYPNPAFSSTSYAWGRGSLRTYDWELSYLATLGLKKSLPVFITETGWIHSAGKIINPSLLSPDQVSLYMKQASEAVWSDSRIVAVTPFVFSYQDVPFDHFSWKELGKNEYYSHYYAYQAIPKERGMPKQHHGFELEQPLLPARLVTNSSYTFSVRMENTGQSILNPQEFSLLLTSQPDGFSTAQATIPTLEPGQAGSMSLHLTTPQGPGTYRLNLEFDHEQSTIPLQVRTVTLIPPPSLVVRAPLAWKESNNASNVNVDIYSVDGQSIQSVSHVSFVHGELTIPNLTNVVPAQRYRVAVTVPYYLPGSALVTFSSGVNELTLKRLFPFDFNNDGVLDFDDIIAVCTLRPSFTFSLFFGK